MTNWRVSWPSNAWMHAARECVTALFGHEW
jgi:hypothetical protein